MLNRGSAFTTFNPIPNTPFWDRPKFKEAADDNWNVAIKGLYDTDYEENIVEKRWNCSFWAISPIFHYVFLKLFFFNVLKWVYMEERVHRSDFENFVEKAMKMTVVSIITLCQIFFFFSKTILVNSNMVSRSINYPYCCILLKQLKWKYVKQNNNNDKIIIIIIMLEGCQSIHTYMNVRVCLFE